MNGVFRIIPGYEGYCVSNNGTIKSIERDLILNQYVLDDYLIVDTFRGSKTETLPVHRAVALAWVNNPNPSHFTIVNHCDGNRTNNWWENLEWTDYSGNNYHAVNTGLRVDNIPCKIRDFTTGEVRHFSSIAQAAEAMGLRKDAPIEMVYPKMFGKLVSDRYEFRFADDQTPWFYESRTKRIPPSRYMITVQNSDGQSKEIYSTKVLLKEYQLYDSPQGRSIPALAQYGNQIHPDKEFNFRDSYAEAQFRAERKTKPSIRVEIKATKAGDVLDFSSLTQCAKHFNVDRSSIVSRINNGKELDGWTFTQ